MRKAIIIIGTVIICGMLTVLGLQAWLGHKIRKSLDGISVERPGAVYNASVGSVSVRLLDRSIHLKNVTVKADTAGTTYDPLPSTRIDMAVKRMKIKGINLRAVIRDRSNINAGILEIVSPEITVTSYPGAGNLSGKRPDTLRRIGAGPAPRVGKKAPKAFVKKIVVADGSLEFRKRNEDWLETFLLYKINIEADNFSTDTLNAPARGMKYADALKIFSEKFYYMSGNGAVELTVDSLNIDTAMDLLSAGRVKLTPQYPKTQYADMVVPSSDWTEMEMDGLACNGMDFRSLLNDKCLKIDSVALGNMRLASYKDHNVEQPPREKSLFYEKIQRLPVKLAVGKIHITSADITYEELARFAGTPGRITFNRLSGDIKGLTNISDPAKPFYTFEASCEVCGSGNLNATFHFPVDPETNHFDIAGRLGRMDMRLLNDMITPLLNIEVVSGVINEMRFKISGDASRSGSELTLLYDGLDIAVMKQKPDGMKERKVLSRIVNDIIIRKSNPDRRGIRTFTATAEHNIHKSQFNYLWKSLQPCVMRSIGINERKQKKSGNK